jgi:hypothetical protein
MAMAIDVLTISIARIMVMDGYCLHDYAHHTPTNYHYGYPTLEKCTSMRNAVIQPRFCVGVVQLKERRKNAYYNKHKNLQRKTLDQDESMRIFIETARPAITFRNSFDIVPSLSSVYSNSKVFRAGQPLLTAARRARHVSVSSSNPYIYKP